MIKNKIILDTDPGIDDAIAFAILLNACKERVRLVISSYGNTSLENTTRNALLLLSLFGAGETIPVARGANKPSSGNSSYKNAEYVHGNDGLGGFQGALASKLPQNNAIEGDYLKIAYDAIMEGSVREYRNEADPEGGDALAEGGDMWAVSGITRGVDYIALGPLTNLSTLIKKHPDAAGRIGRLVVMGGCLGTGNVTPYAEFNVFCDAESADHVFNVMPDIILAPLDATEKVYFDLQGIEAIGAAKTQASHMRDAAARTQAARTCDAAAVMADIMAVNYHLCVSYGEPGAIMHDSVAVLAYLYPELFEFRACKMKVVCEKKRYGKCEIIEDGGNVRIITGLDPERLKKIITESITAF